MWPAGLQGVDFNPLQTICLTIWFSCFKYSVYKMLILIPYRHFVYEYCCPVLKDNVHAYFVAHK